MGKQYLILTLKECEGCKDLETKLKKKGINPILVDIRSEEGMELFDKVSSKGIEFCALPILIVYDNGNVEMYSAGEAWKYIEKLKV